MFDFLFFKHPSQKNNLKPNIGKQSLKVNIERTTKNSFWSLSNITISCYILSPTLGTITFCQLPEKLTSFINLLTSTIDEVPYCNLNHFNAVNGKINVNG